MHKDFDITKVKLIIWDLDNTFWHGTLSEGDVSFINDNLILVEELLTKGIMNSICSKNDFFNVKKEFILQGYIKYWQQFVFPSINWSAKGQRVKNIIKSMQLREENVLVIDDNKTNIEEIKYYCPKIMSAFPEQIKKIADELYMVNDYDFKHLRLKQYKILENKNKDMTLLETSNEDFLKNSKIKICIKDDCIENIDRIEHMILRTNQLNFTKKRINKEVLKNIFLQKDKYESRYIIIEDIYGNYGICGFYVLNKENKELEHFLFSCRIMNMGAEQFIYKYLNYPKINIVPPISSELKTDVDWIEIVDNLEIKQQEETSKQNSLNILFKGACDLYSAISYIDGDCNIDTEFPFWNKQLLYISSHTHPAFIEQTNRLSEEELMSLCTKFPNPHPDEFKTEFFNPKYKIVVLSMLQAAFRGIYINKNNGHFVEYGYTNCDITDEKNWEKVLESIPDNFKEQNRQILADFKKEYSFAGNPPIELIKRNLKYIREHLNPETYLILILGSEINTDKKLRGYEGVCDKHIILNRHIREFAKNYKNIDIIEITELIDNENDYTECINHFSRKVYIKLADKIVYKVNKFLNKECLSLKSTDNQYTESKNLNESCKDVVNVS